MTNERMNDGLEVARVEAFLAPLDKVSPATRSTGAARAPRRLRRVALAVLALVALGAGVAVAATTTSSTNTAKLITVVEQNGETHEGVFCQLVPQGGGDIPEHAYGLRRLQPGDPCPDIAPYAGRSLPRAPAAIPSGEPEKPLVPISEAQSRVEFPISLPDALPADYKFSGAWLPGDASQVRLHFAGPRGDIVLIEEQSSGSQPKPEGFEFQTTVNGYAALGVKGDIPPQETGPVSQLIWWTGEMRFDLYGPVSYSQIETAAASVPVSQGR